MIAARQLGTIAIILLLLGLVLLKSGQVYRIFVFLPEYHGSWQDAWSQGLLDLQGGWAFTKSTPGLLFQGGGLAALFGAGACWFLALRSD